MRVAAGLSVLVGLGFVALFLVLAPGPQRPAAVAQVASDAVVDGRLLYIQNCSSCHGLMGGGSPSGPALTDSGPAALDFYMRTGRMPPAYPGAPDHDQTPQLTPAQVAAILSYASQFSHGPAIPSVTDGADVARGWGLYINNCAACHGAAGDGGSVGGGISAPSLKGRDATTIAEAMIVGPGAMPQFSFAQADQDAIVAYVQSLDHPVTPGAFPIAGGPVEEGAIAAVLGVCALIAISMWVARRDSLPEEATERQDAHGEDESA